MGMSSFAMIVMRLVPLLLLLSAFLIAARVIADRVGPRASKPTFFTIITIGVAIVVAAALQTGAAVLAHEAFLRQRWERVDSSYRAYVAMHGSVSRTMAYEWAVALMHGAQWPRAIEMLTRTGTQSPRGILLNSDVTLLIGECLYYSGDLRRAEAAVGVARRARRPEARDYFLARIAERKGRTSDAAALYASSVAHNSQFYPAIYHRARLLVAAGAAPQAVAALDAVRQFDPSITADAAWRNARDAASRGVTPQNVEFYVLEA